MVNNIGKVFVLDSGDKYIVSKQAIYKNDNYYVVLKLSEDGEEITDDIKFIKEVKENDEVYLEEISDKKTLELIGKNLNLMN